MLDGNIVHYDELEIVQLNGHVTFDIKHNKICCFSMPLKLDKSIYLAILMMHELVYIEMTLHMISCISSLVFSTIISWLLLLACNFNTIPLCCRS